MVHTCCECGRSIGQVDIDANLEMGYYEPTAMRCFWCYMNSIIDTEA